MEVGPYRVGAEGKLSYNDGSWDEFANVLFVDNPVGTGFSYVDTNAYVHELDEMADQFVVFLEKWFTLFPEYMHDDVSPFQNLRSATTDAFSRFILRANRMLVSIFPTSRATCSTGTNLLGKIHGT